MTTHCNPISVFLSYAHEDESLLRQLETHLSLLKRQNLISSWYDRQIVPGSNRAQTIDERLEQASIILLLVSPDFIASDYCYQVEMQRALERDQVGQAKVIPIVLRPCDWKGAPFAHLQVLPTNAKAITTWSNQDEAFVNVVVGIRRAIEVLPLFPIGTSRTAQPIIWNVPYPRNPFFIGRSDLFQRLHTQFQANQATAHPQAQALVGLGGIGKTQITIEYAYSTRHQYRAVFWVYAETYEALISGYVSISEQLKLPEMGMQDPTIIVQAVLHWFTTHTDWLLVLDNADDLAVVREFLPTMFSGHILLTTRAQATGRLANRIEVDAMDAEIGARFLLHRAGLIPNDIPLKCVATSDVDAAREICEELGGLPLALDQAGAYIEETQCNLSQYLERYRAHQIVLLQRRGGLVSDHPEPVATTWSIAFAKVEQKSPAAADLLRLCAFLHPDAIPEELLIYGATHLGSLLQPVTANPFLLDEVISILSAYSLIRRNARERTLTVHRLVQATLKDTLDADLRRQWIQRVILVVAETFSHTEIIPEPQYERYLPHARLCAAFIAQEQLMSLEAAHLLYQTGNYLCKHAGNLKEAEQLLQRALAIRDLLSDSEYSETVEILNLLGNLYGGRWKFKQAEQYYQRALMIRERQVGLQGLGLVTSLNNLAHLYIGPHKYKQSEKYYRRALTIREQALGPGHLDVAESLIDLAFVYRRQGKYNLAEPLYQRALTIREQALGPDHPDIAEIFYSLAAIYKRQGKQERATWCDQRVVTLYGQQLKSQHSGTKTMLNMLVWYYHNVPETAKQVEEYLCQALAIWELQQGSQHPDMVPLLDSLGVIYTTQGKYEQAELFLQRAIAIQEQQLGMGHLAVVKHLSSLAGHYGKRGKYEQAEELYLRELSFEESVYGAEHPHIAPCLNNLGEMCEAQGKHEQAEQHWLRAIAIWKQAEGPKSPNAASCHYKLARLYQRQEKYRLAEELYREAFTIWDKTIRPEYIKEQRAQFASFLRMIGKEEEATQLEKTE